MRTKLLLVVTFLSVALISCSRDEIDNPITDPLLHGEWNLKKASTGWYPQDDLEAGIIEFIFDTENSILNVINNNETYLFVPESGQFPYTIVNFQDSAYIIFEDERFHYVEDGIIYGHPINYFETDEGQQMMIEFNRWNCDNCFHFGYKRWILIR
ncbi:MAG: hypothetical protein HRU49_07385 [Winogradskyella sp.]|uniref:hypothetical protein n=1 Tax=Winogradskyella sp. TaxID=1883156 RepID=UPI0025F9F86E|nr:hypothetical protein [Winogradskyella sp.]NRB83581.1 hypothetical protein [Winogradskyella sp.]